MRTATRNLKRIEPAPHVFIETCGECGSDLVDRLQVGTPTYCDECDRIPDNVDRRDNRPAIIADAIEHLKSARDLLTDCGAPAAADYVRRALKSAEGALRHAEARANR